MPADHPRFLYLTASGGSLLRHALGYPWFRELVHSVFTHTDCGAIEVAAAWNVPVVNAESQDNEEISDRILAHCLEHEIDIIYSTYNRILVGDLLAVYAGRILNLHPSILPAFRGLRPISQAIEAGTKLIGNTVHVVIPEVDAGPIVAQSIVPFFGDFPRMRHHMFHCEVKLTMQMFRWLADGRFRLEGNKAWIADARYEPGQFSPNLEDPDVLAFHIPYPPPA